jgi:uncharacterized protein with GYD domain
MPKYMIIISYTAEGARGLLKEGGTSRRKVAEDLAKGMGGTIESFYFAFGADDVYVIGDFPDAESAAAVSLALGASGAVRARTVVLLTPEEVDGAAKKTVDYRPPGG